jgi:hypothetical protein
MAYAPSGSNRNKPTNQKYLYIDSIAGPSDVAENKDSGGLCAYGIKGEAALQHYAMKTCGGVQL